MTFSFIRLDYFYQIFNLFKPPIKLLVFFIYDIKSLEGVQGIPAFADILVNPTEVIQLLSLFTRNVCSHIPGVCQWHQGFVVVILNSLSPLFLGSLLGLNRFDAFTFKLLKQFDDDINLAFDEWWTIRECRGRYRR